ncbi:MAG: hypothetical protein MK185_04770 [Saccharospirillaceae bacterium]|nr:hypothetical protein [Saccharospirillaceae bacterium]
MRTDNSPSCIEQIPSQISTSPAVIHKHLSQMPSGRANAFRKRISLFGLHLSPEIFLSHSLLPCTSEVHTITANNILARTMCGKSTTWENQTNDIAQIEDMPEFKTNDEIRRQNARLLAKEEGSNAAFARKIGREPTQVSRIIGKNWTTQIGEDLARHIEASFFKPKGWIDQDWAETNKVAEESAVYGAPQEIPVFHLRDIETGYDQPLFKMPCPVEHSPQTYAAKVHDNTMQATMGPSYPEGSIIFVDPERAAEAQNGDLVVFRLSESGVVGFKRLVDNETVRGLEPLNIRYPMVPQQDFEVIGLVIGCWIGSTAQP